MKHILFVLSFFLCLATIAQPRFTDSTFGTNGNIIKNTSVPYKEIIDMVLQTDGKAVVLADAYYNGVERVVLIRYNTSGTPDNSFSGDGIADSLFQQGIDFYPEAIKLQPDGKILVCGYTSGFPNTAFVIRYGTNGSPDPSFGNGGIFYEPAITIGNTTSNVPSIDNLVVLPDGKIMLLSSFYSSDSNADLILTRLNANGRVDSTYGTNGMVAQDVSESYSPKWTRMEIQTDGKLLIGGNPAEYDPTSGTVLAATVLRLNANGTIDNTYGSNGRADLHVGLAEYEVFKDMALQPDGKVVVSGIGENYSGIYNYAFAVRLNTNGTPDAGFGSVSGGGTVLGGTTPFYSTEGQMSLQADGKVLLAGCSALYPGNYTMALARLTTTGQPDITFDGDGVAMLLPNNYTNYAIAVQQQADGKLVLGSLARSENNASVTIARLTATGQPDATLNAIAAITPIGSGAGGEAGLSLQLQPDGKILSINARYSGTGYDFSISRYTPSGVPDSTYGRNGTGLSNALLGYRAYFSGLLSNGKLMVASSCSDYFSGYGIYITRTNANGTTDSSFGNNGRLFIKTRTEAFVNVSPQVSFQPDGKMVLLYAQMLDDSFAGDSTFVVRLNADGSYDNTFNATGRKYLPDSSYSQFNLLCVQPDGKIIVNELRGQGGQGGYSISALRRLLPNGNTDNTFNNGNTVPVPFEVDDLILQTDSKILAGGGSAVVFRLNTNGIPDTAFGTAGYANASATFSNFYGLYSIREADSNRIVLAGLVYDTITFAGSVAVVALKKNGLPDTSFGNAGMIARPDIVDLQSSSAMIIQPDKKILLTGYTEGFGNYEAPAILTRLKANGLTTGRLYTFTGNGLWSNAANWSDGTVPPTTIAAGSSLVIDPPTTGECVIDITVHVQAGATVTVKAGKKLRLPGNLMIQ